MTIWIDAQLSPALVPFIASTFGIEAFSVAFLGLRDAEDEVIFQKARETNAVGKYFKSANACRFRESVCDNSTIFRTRRTTGRN
jgi:Domain of unknown function (DUF5615)